MIDVYRRLLRGVRSINRLNRLQINVENKLTPLLARQLSSMSPPTPGARLLALQGPARATQLGETIGEKLYQGAETWRLLLEEYMVMARKAEPEPFIRKRLLRDVFLFTDPAAKGPKRLLIFFADQAQRPLMPLHTFLQHLDAQATDMLFLRDPSRKAFRLGLFDVGSSLDDIVAHLPRLVDLSSYREVHTMGTSAGGLPAIVAGLALGTRSATSVGGIHPVNENWTFDGRLMPEALPRRRQTTGADTQVYLMWGAQSRIDPVAAYATSDLVGGTMLVISGRNNTRIGHLPLYPLARQHLLIKVLEAIFATNVHPLNAVSTIEIRDAPAKPASAQ